MVRRGKLKYKDVVKKQGTPRNTQKKQRSRKTYSLYKNDSKNNASKRKYTNEIRDEIDKTKKRKLDSDLTHKNNVESSSEGEDDVTNLLSTFTENLVNKKAIDSSSESENEDNQGEEALTDGNGEITNLTDSSISSESADSENIDENEIALELELEDQDNLNDPFRKHIHYELHDSLLDSLQNNPVLIDSFVESWPELGKLIIQIPKYDTIIESKDSEFSISEKKSFAPGGVVPKRILKLSKPKDIFIKSQIIGNLAKVNKSVCGCNSFTPLQAELFSITNNYQDLYFPGRTFDNAEELRYVYCLHAVNHILKTRLKVIHHNSRLSKKDEVPEEFRDQGLVRPKVLFIVPFKDAAYKIIRMLIDLILPEDKGNVMNKNRFIVDYTGNELILPKRNPKPEDYELTFQGNTSDDFKIGITVTKKSLKLYADFYSSDIIIASPLGLRTIIGAEGEPDRDYDFLASIELLIMDQTEIFLMQNWDHVLHTLNHLHLQPKDSHGSDFSRVRVWSLNGWAKYYRQTLIFSSSVLPEINSIFNKKCVNYSGKVKVMNPIELGCIGQVIVQVPHVYHKFDCQNAAESMDARFDFFTKKILPQFRESLMKQTLIFIPSYFDFVRVRNYFKREDISFVQICEYSKEGKVARARDMFFHGDAHFLLYTERFHFFNRKNIKGIRHLLFYQPPAFSNFYYEICNLMQESNQNKKVGSNSNMSVTVMYSKYDVYQLSSIVSTEKAHKMMHSDRKVHMMVTGGE